MKNYTLVEWNEKLHSVVEWNEKLHSVVELIEKLLSVVEWSDKVCFAILKTGTMLLSGIVYFHFQKKKKNQSTHSLWLHIQKPLKN